MSIFYEGSQSQWQVDLLFDQNFTKNKKKNELGAHLKQLFIDLLNNGEDINIDYQQNKYQIRQGIVFKCQNKFQQIFNFQFLKNSPHFQIFNLAFFITNIQRQLKSFNQQIKDIVQLTQIEKDLFQQKTKLKLCKSHCPCCDRLCDVDMEKDPHHSIHRIQSGHQMRAVKGMVVQKKVNGVIQLYASVLRCQDVNPKARFQYYGKQWIWQNFIQDKKNQWDFKSPDINKQLFQHIWNVCGSKICKQSGKNMKYIKYSDGNIQFIQNKEGDTQFIFAIDGSGSMNGQPWRTQLQEIKKILNDISNDESNRVTILVFNNNCHPFCINKQPSKIDVNQIPYPGGGTRPNPTFQQAARILKTKNLSQNRSSYIFYISDGYGQHPNNGIRLLLQCKRQMELKGLSFNYTSILIGDCSTGKNCMEKINQQMGGSSLYAQNAGSISQKIRQILNN